MSQDIGELGPETGASVDYPWPIYRHFASLFPLLIVLALMLLKSNRTPKAWLIFVPIAIGVVIFYLPVAAMALLSVSTGSPFGGVSWLLGLASLWLIADRLAGMKGPWAFLLAVFVLIAFALVEAVLRGEEMSMLAFMVVPAVTPLLALMWAASWCRRRFSGPRYVGMLACACAAVVSIGIVASTVFFLVWMGAFRTSILLSFIIGVPVMTAVGAVAVFVLLLPFVVLSLKSRFYRQRFVAALRLPVASAPPAVPAENANP